MSGNLDRDKLAKVLALAESDHPGEAMSALRAARIMLARVGLNVRDLAVPAAGGTEPPPPAPPPTLPPAEDRRLIHELETKLRHLERTVERQLGEIDRQKADAERWRKLAQETAERLWDLGKTLDGKAKRPSLEDRRRTLIAHLRDPLTARLSDRELARRVGFPPATVAQWRHRLRAEEGLQKRLRGNPRGRLARAGDAGDGPKPNGQGTSR